MEDVVETAPVVVLTPVGVELVPEVVGVAVVVPAGVDVVVVTKSIRSVLKKVCLIFKRERKISFCFFP